MRVGEQPNGVWPPPPVREEPEAWEEPRAPRITDDAVGRIALGLSVFGSFCALAGVFSGVLDPRSHWFGLWEALQAGAVGGSVAGLFVGFVGWCSWEGKAALGLALASPLWIVVALLVASVRRP